MLRPSVTFLVAIAGQVAVNPFLGPRRLKDHLTLSTKVTHIPGILHRSTCRYRPYHREALECLHSHRSEQTTIPQLSQELDLPSTDGLDRSAITEVVTSQETTILQAILQTPLAPLCLDMACHLRQGLLIPTTMEHPLDTTRLDNTQPRL